MDKQVYLKKFSYIVRWRLPRPEAEEVLADYEDIFTQHERENDDLFIQEFDKPFQAARLLTEPKVYHRWLAAFGLMTFCLCIPAFMILRARFYQSPMAMMSVLLVLGMAAALVWFWPYQRKYGKPPFPKGLLSVLLGVFMIIVAAVVILANLAAGTWEFLPPEWYGRIAYGTMELTAAAAAMTGFLGLVKARMSDCRWCALYIIGLTVLVECVLVVAVLVSMDMEVLSSDWWVSYGIKLGVIGVMGTVGAGAALC